MLDVDVPSIERLVHRSIYIYIIIPFTHGSVYDVIDDDVKSPYILTFSRVRADGMEVSVEVEVEADVDVDMDVEVEVNVSVGMDSEVEVVSVVVSLVVAVAPVQSNGRILLGWLEYEYDAICVDMMLCCVITSVW